MSKFAGLDFTPLQPYASDIVQKIPSGEDFDIHMQGPNGNVMFTLNEVLGSSYRQQFLQILAQADPRIYEAISQREASQSRREALQAVQNGQWTLQFRDRTGTPRTFTLSSNVRRYSDEDIADLLLHSGF